MKRFIWWTLLFAACFGQPAMADDTLYQQLGGQAGVALIAKDPITLILADRRVKNDFDNINLDRLRSRLIPAARRANRYARRVGVAAARKINRIPAARPNKNGQSFGPLV